MKSADFEHKKGQALLVSTSRHHYAAFLCLATFFAAFISVSLAQAETRTLRMYFTHTKESATITFKKNGKYLPSGLKKANRFLRDWRRKEPTRMDPALLDLVWEVYQKSGSRKPIKVISGYRSPRTNNMLRRRGRKVARKSQHTKGKALDFFLQDVSVAKLRALGLKAHRGGVGYYAGSFVHLDTGSVRHWPRMSRRQLARIFPKGKTIHVPSNGKPLKGYKIAKANLKKGLNADGTRRTTKVRKTLLAGLFNNKADSADEDEAGAAARRREAKRPNLPKPIKPASLKRRPDGKSGSDPFSIENKVGDQPEPALVEQKRRDDKPAKKNADESQIALGRIAIPRLRPKRPAVRQAPVILAAAPPAADESRLSPAAPTQLALAAPVVLPQTLRPAADIPEPNAAERQQVAELRSKIETALARGRIKTPAEIAVDLQGGQQAGGAKYIPVPSRTQNRPSSTQLALASISDQTSRNGGIAAPVGRPADGRSIVVDRSRFDSAKPVDPTTPSWRNTLKQELLAASADRLKVPLPTSKPIRNDQPAVLASGGESSFTEDSYGLSLGDLDSNSVKEWAVSLTTRIGPSAALTAPNYRQSTQQVAPSKVYSAGFDRARFKLRSDRFSGRALTHVAFATFD